MAYNADTAQTPNTFLRTIKIIHLALVAGQVLFALTVIVVSKRIVINVRDTQDPLVYAVPAFAVICFILSNLLFKKMLVGINNPDSSLKKKMAMYQTALMIRLALLEAPSLFGTVAFFLTGLLMFLVISALMVAYFIYIRPTDDNVKEALALTYSEKEIFNRRNNFLQ